MGVLQTGVFIFPIHFIPPGAESFKSYGICNTSHFEEMNGAPVPDMHVFGYLLHTHLAGRGVRGVLYRNGEQGDEFLVECRYQTLDRTEITFGGLSTLNEMCLAFIFYYPRNNISSCMGYPNIQQVANELGQEASDAIEGMTAIDLVEWNNETIKKAEKACKEADQTVVIKTIDELVRNETGFIREIADNIQVPCKDISRTRIASQAKRNFEHQAFPPMTSKAHKIKGIFPLPTLLFIPLGFTWLFTSSM
ncbi:hypothetical protein JD844_009834 [Phrynosoma platyrhinos]|uniref:Copper type II ascorbate-dependent monooxygenase C-terminal domain-containing protein n=1 Tax=Phrynosoma platyrhinos TaxID=52577 RepID=A0ABQ7TFU0_PHRPL|nr:hypothetical protein JD844_009834 [Phrynosoma platyrhinos]